jgi:endoglucanase
MAMAARVFEPMDPAFAATCLRAAERGYRFLVEHPEDHQADLRGFSTGGYGSRDADDRLWAAAELWQTTGKAEYLADFERRAPTPEPAGWFRRNDDGDNRLVDFNWDWGDVSNLGVFTYLFSERPGRSEQLVARLRGDVLAVADRVVDTAASHGYARPLGSRYYWGANGTVARLTMVLEVADRLQPRPEYRATKLAAVDWLFGRNYYGRSQVTGLGHNPPRHPHDRRNGIGGVTSAWPGYLVGGGWPSARDWHDEEEDFRTNEIAINWNGALIYALAGLVEPGSFDAIRAAR